eukprot:INCI9888.2.p1 GENE.INCI9888.2~~INCI9888.2.p1  ORF type:complete len:395 (-),score=50.35 INCI9888.2:545-1729(-)
MPMLSESARILREYRELERRESLKTNKRAAETHAQARVLVARERIQAKSMEVALRRDRLMRAKVENDPRKANRELVQKHKGRQLALLNERPTKGMAVFVFKGFLFQQRKLFRHREVEVCEIIEDLGPTNPLPYTVRWNTDGARLSNLPKAVLLPFTDGQEEGKEILEEQWATFLRTRPKMGDLVFVGRSALHRMGPEVLKPGEISPYKGRQTLQAKVITDLGPGKMWPYRVQWLHDGLTSPEHCYLSAFELLKIEKGSKDDVVSKAAMEEELAASVAALQAYDGHKLKAKEFVKMKRSHSARPGLRPSSKLRRRGATAGSRRPRSRAKVPIGHREVEPDHPSFMLALSRATTPGWSKLEKQKTDFTSVGTWESVKHKEMDELEDSFNRREPIAT